MLRRQCQLHYYIPFYNISTITHPHTNRISLRDSLSATILSLRSQVRGANLGISSLLTRKIATKKIGRQTVTAIKRRRQEATAYKKVVEYLKLMANEQSEHLIGWDQEELTIRMNLLMKLRKLSEGELIACTRILDMFWSIIWMKQTSNETVLKYRSNSKRNKKINKVAMLKTALSEVQL